MFNNYLVKTDYFKKFIIILKVGYKISHYFYYKHYQNNNDSSYYKHIVKIIMIHHNCYSQGM